MIAWIILIVVLLAGIALLLGQDTTALTGLAPGQIASIIFASIVLLFIGGSVWRQYEGRLGTGVRDMAIWIAGGLALVAVYAFRDEIGLVSARVGIELSPPGTAVQVTEQGDAGASAVRLRKRDDGHFVARAQVNGEALQLMVDTGASSIVLRPVDAERAGIDLAGLVYSVPVSTANGTAYAAPVRLSRVSIGPLEVRDIPALVAKPGVLDENLLGMSFLSKLKSYTFSGDFLTLRG